MWHLQMKRKKDQRNLRNPEKESNMCGHAMKAAFQISDLLNRWFYKTSPTQKVGNLEYVLPHFICMDKLPRDQRTIKMKAYRYQKKTWVDFLEDRSENSFPVSLQSVIQDNGKPQK